MHPARRRPLRLRRLQREMWVIGPWSDLRRCGEACLELLISTTALLRRLHPWLEVSFVIIAAHELVAMI
jgi:hypothetical protein